MAQKAMVIDLHNCVGCGACGIACKTENNTPFSTERTTFNWADYYTSTEGVFPEVKYNNFPVLCNHCSDAPCVEACPVEDKAIFKTADGVTMTNNERCIGCQSCVKACPYSSIDVQGRWSKILHLEL
ncbi:MAG: 4Fe-4S dicluster domain-containing protein [Cyclobacteriaceae bacterium]|nr:4Fe-4S dicluster domain-containing protein [Cyclobacteriaceae bacterium]